MPRRRIQFDPPLDVGVRRYVQALVRAGVRTFESCEGGRGHAYPEPTIRFHGGERAGRLALAVALRADLPVAALRRTWPIVEGDATGPYWELVFDAKDGATRTRRSTRARRAR